MEHEGLEREYFVYLPAGWERTGKYPVVLFLHGYGGSATGTEAETTNGLNRYADEYGYIMAYPQSTWFMSDGPPEERWEVSTWNHVSGGFDEGPQGPICIPTTARFPCPPSCGDCGQCGWTPCVDDVGFFEKLLNEINSDLNVDADRIFLSGYSSGSMMAHYLGCQKSDWFAAVMLVQGRLETGFQCQPTKALPLFQLVGGRDRTVPGDGSMSKSGYFYASSKATMSAWNEGAGCEEEPRYWSSPLSDEHGLQCTATCSGTDRESIDCLWPDGEHYWPGYPIGHGSYGYCVTEMQRDSMPDQTLCVEPDTSVDVWGSRLMFDFFETH